MKHIKHFENNNATEYAKTAKIGDILVCIKTPEQYDSKEMQRNLKYGDKYEIISIDIPRPKDDQPYYYFDLKNLNTENIIIGYGAVCFQPEIKFYTDKYNL